MPDRPFKNPPIVEALIDVECDLPVGFDLAAMESLGQAAYGAEFPTVRKQIQDTFQIPFGPDGPSQPAGNRDLMALQFVSADEKTIVQLRLQGMAFNRLAPYDNFDSFRAGFRTAWEKYVEIVKPVALRALRLRYINDIALPQGEAGVDLDEWLTIGPRIAEDNRLRVRSFLNQCSNLDPATGREVSTVLASKPQSGAEFHVVLDLTVTGRISNDPGDWEGIKAELDALRDLKNRVFLGSIQEKCWRRFE